MAYWWDGNPDERHWVEIRRLPGLGHSLASPTLDKDGQQNAWYTLLGTVSAGEMVYHYNARESRFVGRSVTAGKAHIDLKAGWIEVPLRDFTPIVATVDLRTLRETAEHIYKLRDQLASNFGGPLYLPFQFTKNRDQFRMLSNYFAKMPAELVSMLFGSDGLAGAQVPTAPPLPGEEPADPADSAVDPGKKIGGFLDPFRPKADADYVVDIVGGQRRRTRRHERLVNQCARWLESEGLTPGRNAAVDLGTLDPPVIFEAKMVGTSWPTAIREAVGQLYEYRYFKVAEPRAGLVFLASREVPDAWVAYLERDRQIGCMWPKGRGHVMSPLARKLLKL